METMSSVAWKDSNVFSVFEFADADGTGRSVVDVGWVDGERERGSGRSGRGRCDVVGGGGRGWTRNGADEAGIVGDGTGRIASMTLDGVPCCHVRCGRRSSRLDSSELIQLDLLRSSFPLPSQRSFVVHSIIVRPAKLDDGERIEDSASETSSTRLLTSSTAVGIEVGTRSIAFGMTDRSNCSGENDDEEHEGDDSGDCERERVHQSVYVSRREERGERTGVEDLRRARRVSGGYQKENAGATKRTIIASPVLGPPLGAAVAEAEGAGALVKSPPTVLLLAAMTAAR